MDNSRICHCCWITNMISKNFVQWFGSYYATHMLRLTFTISPTTHDSESLMLMSVIMHGPYLKWTQLLFVIWRHCLRTACPCLSLSVVVSIGVSSSTQHEFALARVQIWTSVHSTEIFGIWPQASKQASRHTHAHAQCSHASVGLAQAHPNHHMKWVQIYTSYERNRSRGTRYDQFYKNGYKSTLVMRGTGAKGRDMISSIWVGTNLR